MSTTRKTKRVQFQCEALESRNLLSGTSQGAHVHTHAAPSSQPRYQQVTVVATLKGTVKTTPAETNPLLKNTSISASGGQTSLGPLKLTASDFTVVGATVSPTFVIIEPGTFTIKVPSGTMTSNTYTGTANLTPNHQGFAATLYGNITGGTGIFPHAKGRIKTPTGVFNMSARGNLITGTFTGRLKFTVKVIPSS